MPAAPVAVRALDMLDELELPDPEDFDDDPDPADDWTEESGC
jgi:hypothetical protein